MEPQQLTDLQELIRQMKRTSKTPSQGASTVLVAALDPNATTYGGSVLEDCQVVDNVKRDGAVEELWTLGETGRINSSIDDLAALSALTVCLSCRSSSGGF